MIKITIMMMMKMIVATVITTTHDYSHDEDHYKDNKIKDKNNNNISEYKNNCYCLLHPLLFRKWGEGGGGIGELGIIRNYFNISSYSQLIVMVTLLLFIIHQLEEEKGRKRRRRK